MPPPLPSRRATFARVVLPFALIPPLMIVFAMRDHPQVYRLDPAATNWEWIALLVFVAEIASVSLIAGMLRLTAPPGRRPPPAQNYLIAARAASPLWASAIVLAIPSLAVLVAVHLLAHAVSLRALYRDVGEQLQAAAGDLEALHVTYMVYSVAVVFWIPLLVMIFVSLSPA